MVLKEMTKLEKQIIIKQVQEISQYIDELVHLLIQVVEDGASVGFLPPLPPEKARNYWLNVLNEDTKLWVALMQNEIIGTVQLQLCNKPNGRHRAEIAKLMTSPRYRRTGVGRALMQSAEEAALLDQRSLLVLDTRQGDPSNLLYQSLGYQQAGVIPSYAQSANGQLHATVFYYKLCGN